MPLAAVRCGVVVKAGHYGDQLVSTRLFVLYYYRLCVRGRAGGRALHASINLRSL